MFFKGLTIFAAIAIINAFIFMMSSYFENRSLSVTVLGLLTLVGIHFVLRFKQRS